LRSASERSGKGDFSPLWCGQNTSGCKPITAASLTQQLVAGIQSR
jgi:nitronate monooxygenase